MRLLFTILILLIISFKGISQDMLGVTNSSYSGINGLIINPANIADSRLYIDIQLFSGSMYMQNDFIYFDKDKNKLSDFFSKNLNELDSIRSMFDPFQKQDKINGYVNSRINGPGIMLSVGRHSFALSNAFRMVGGTRNTLERMADLGFFGLNNKAYQQSDFSAGEFTFAGASFEELNLSYALIISNIGKNHIALGITAKGLLGSSGLYFSNVQSNYSYHQADSIHFDMDSELGLCLPLNYDDTTKKSTGLSFSNGGGVAFDIGFVMQKNFRKRNFESFHSLKEQKYYGYKYKFGVSLIDVGYIKFKNNAQKHVFEDASVNYTQINKLEITSFNKYTRSISYAFYNDSSQTLQDDKFTVFLPMALSMQFDYYFGNDIYLNTTFIQGLNFFKNQIKRPTVLSISPRLDNKRFQVHLPLSLINFRQAQVGLAVNYENVTIGTDRIMFWNKKMYGMDFYISAKIPLEKNQPTTF